MVRGFHTTLVFLPKWIGNKLFINQFERAFWLNFLHILRNHVVTKNHACGTINMFLQLWRIGSRCKNSHNNSCSEWVGFGLVARFTTFTCVGTDSSTNTVHRSDTFAWYGLQELVLKVLKIFVWHLKADISRQKCFNFAILIQFRTKGNDFLPNKFCQLE